VSDKFLEENARGRTHIPIPPDTARIVVLTPVGGEKRRERNRTLIDDVVVRYAD
jgi:hypothetical protein